VQMYKRDANHFYPNVDQLQLAAVRGECVVVRLPTMSVCHFVIADIADVRTELIAIASKRLCCQLLKGGAGVSRNFTDRSVARNLIWVGINVNYSHCNFNLSWVKKTKQPHKKLR